jgi:hypothetical protein
MVSETAQTAATERGSRPTTRLILPLGLMLGAFLLYSSTASKHYSEGEDGSTYVIQVTSPSSIADLFHPNHLAYNALNRVVYLVCRQFGYEGNASLPMQIVNAAAGALTLGLMMRILRRLNVDDRLALSWVCVTAVCFGFWSYSTQPETYILPLVPILWCIDLIIGLSDDEFSYRALIWLGCSGAIATLLHQQHVLVLFAITITAAIVGYQCRSEVPMRRVVVGLGLLCLAAATIVGASYFTVAIGINHLYTPQEIIQWSKGHAKNGLWTPWSYTNPIQSILVGFPRAVLGGHFLYGFDWFFNPVSRRFPTKLLIEERYLSQHLSSATRLACLAAAGVALVSTLAVFRTLWFPAEAVPVEYKRRTQAAATIILLLIFEYYVFNTLWEPANVEFWIVLLPVLGIAVAMLQARRPGAIRWWFAGAALAFSLFVANGLGSILPQTRRDTDFWYQANTYLIQHARAGDTIVTDGAMISDMYLRVFTGADVVSARTTDRLTAILLESGSKRVWISSWAIEPLQEVRATGMLPPADEKSVQRSIQAVGDRMVKRDEGRYQTIWELMPAGQ